MAEAADAPEGRRRVVFLDAEGTILVPRPGRTPREFWGTKPHTVERALEIFEGERGVEGVLARLRGRGCTLCLVSRHKRNLLRDILQALGLYDYFDRILVEEDKGLAARAYLEEVGLPPEAALMVGDTPWLDVDGPRAQGLRALLLDRPYNQGEGYERLRSLEELLALVEEPLKAPPGDCPPPP